MVSTKYRKRIAASLRVVGLLEPLIVFPLDQNFEILDGCVRYRILLEWDVPTVPCLVGPEREAYTGNRMVNQLSAPQEIRMLRKSLEELDENTIAGALGMYCLRHRLNTGMLKKLDPKLVAAFETDKISLQCAKELTHVKPDQQVEILGLMQSCNDHSVTFARGLILKTPPNKRAKANGAKTPWSQAESRKSDLLRRLQEAEQQQDFYSGLYRQYTANLLKLVMYVRSLLANANVRQYLLSHHPHLCDELEQIINATER